MLEAEAASFNDTDPLPWVDLDAVCAIMRTANIAMSDGSYTRDAFAEDKRKIREITTDADYFDDFEHDAEMYFRAEVGKCVSTICTTLVKTAAFTGRGEVLDQFADLVPVLEILKSSGSQPRDDHGRFAESDSRSGDPAERDESRSPAQIALADFEERVLTKNVEHAAAVASDGMVLFTTSGDATSVDFTKEQLAKMRGATLTHNHPPQSGLLSSQDIGLLTMSKLAAIRSVGVCDGMKVTCEASYPNGKPKAKEAKAAMEAAFHDAYKDSDSNARMETVLYAKVPPGLSASERASLKAQRERAARDISQRTLLEHYAKRTGMKLSIKVERAD